MSGVERARGVSELGPVDALSKLGLTCHVDEAFCGVVYLIERFSGDLESALIENTMAGGDSAARGMLVGMLLGAEGGMEAIPKRWIDKLSKRVQIESYVSVLSSSCESCSFTLQTAKEAAQTERSKKWNLQIAMERH